MMSIVSNFLQCRLTLRAYLKSCETSFVRSVSRKPDTHLLGDIVLDSVFPRQDVIEFTPFHHGIIFPLIFICSIIFLVFIFPSLFNKFFQVISKFLLHALSASSLNSGNLSQNKTSRSATQYSHPPSAASNTSITALASSLFVQTTSLALSSLTSLTGKLTSMNFYRSLLITPMISFIFSSSSFLKTLLRNSLPSSVANSQYSKSLSKNCNDPGYRNKIMPGLFRP